MPDWFKLIRQFQCLDHPHRGALCITLSDAFDTFYLFYQFQNLTYNFEMKNSKKDQSMKQQIDLRALIMLISLMVALFFTQTSKVSTIKHNVSNPYAGFVIK